MAPEAKLPAIVEDVEDAFAWLREQRKELFQIDPDRCVVAGESAGGYLALMAGARLKPRPKGIISYWGFADITQVDSPAYVDYVRKQFPPIVQKQDAYKEVGRNVLTSTRFGTETAKARDQYFSYVLQNGIWTKDVAGLELKDRRQREQFSPVLAAKRDFPPTLFIHRAADRLIKTTELEAMAARLAQFKVPQELVVVRGAGHGLTGGDPKLVEAAHARAAAFIQQRLSDPRRGK